MIAIFKSSGKIMCTSDMVRAIWLVDNTYTEMSANIPRHTGVGVGGLAKPSPKGSPEHGPVDKSAVKSAIGKKCLHKVHSGDLYHEIVNVQELCGKTVLYRLLKEYCGGDNPFLARHPKTGQSGEVWYVVKEHEDELDSCNVKPVKKDAHEPNQDMKFLAERVVRSADELLTELRNHDWDDKKAELAIIRKSMMVEGEVMKLKPSYPELTLWVDRELKRVKDEYEFQIACGIKRPKLKPRLPVLEMSDWQTHWIEVIRVLRSKG
jgi:hypothetical protein